MTAADTTVGGHARRVRRTVLVITGIAVLAGCSAGGARTDPGREAAIVGRYNDALEPGGAGIARAVLEASRGRVEGS